MNLAHRLARLPESAQHGLAALGLLVCVAAMWCGVAPPVKSLVHAQENWRAQSRALLAKTQASAASEVRIRDRLDLLIRMPIWERLYPSSESARSQIQQDLNSLCAGAGVQLETLVDVPGSDDHGIIRIGQRLSFTATAESLGDLIVRLRQHSRYLRVDGLSVTSPQLQSTEAPPLLNVTLEVAGFAKSPADEPALSLIAPRVHPLADGSSST